jgi:nitrite reductase/ring-hydroxylating ferredoxin subunit
VATQPIEEPERLRDLVTLMELYDGEDTTIYASDWPHHDFDHPMKLNQVPFSEEQRRKVFGENALELFGIDSSGAPAVTEVVVGPLADFPAGRTRSCGGRARDRRVQHRRQLLRLPNICPHQTGPLCEGRIATGTLQADADSDWKPRWVMEDEVIACPWHGLGVPRARPGAASLSGDHVAALSGRACADGEVVVTVGGRRR